MGYTVLSPFVSNDAVRKKMIMMMKKMKRTSRRYRKEKKNTRP